MMDNKNNLSQKMMSSIKINPNKMRMLRVKMKTKLKKVKRKMQLL